MTRSIVVGTLREAILRIPYRALLIKFANLQSIGNRVSGPRSAHV